MDLYIYLIFSKTNTWLSKLIRVLTNTKYAHCSISLSHSLQPMYSFGRINPNNAWKGGFVEEGFDRGVFTKFKNCECVVKKLWVTQEQADEIVYQLEAFEKNKSQYKFNFIGLVMTGFRRGVARKNRYFCSQFVATLLQNAGIIDKNLSPERTRHTDLFGISSLETVYEGFTDAFTPHQLIN